MSKKKRKKEEGKRKGVNLKFELRKIRTVSSKIRTVNSVKVLKSQLKYIK